MDIEILSGLRNKRESVKVKILTDLLLYDELIKLTPTIKSVANKIKVVIKNGSDICRDCGKNHINESRIKYRMTCDSCAKKSKRAKTEATNLERYGVKNVYASSDVKSKIKKTNLERLGVDSPLKSPRVRDKVKQTTLERHGVEHALQSPDIYAKLKKTNLVRLGVEHSHQNPDVSQRAKKTIVERYGELYFSDRNKKAFRVKHIDDTEIIFWSENIDKLYEKYVEGNMTIVELSELTGVNRNTIQGWFADNGYERFNRKSSYEEKQFADSLEEALGIRFIRNTRSIIPPYEIDMWFPEKNIGIEYHGLYWHRNDPDRTRDKCILASKNGVELLQFFSSEIDHKQDIVMSIVSAKAGKNKKIFARNTKFSSVDSKTYRKFCDDNHLQGYAAATAKCGLYLGPELVAVMSFSKSRYDKQNEWEMIRFCSKLNLSVVGGPSKLFKNFVAQYDPKTIVTYADARISSGNLYRQLGFTYSHHSKANYKYTNDYNTLYSRIKFQKHKLKNILEKYDETITEKENMTNNNYSAIYDAGNYVFEWSKT